MAYCTRCSEHVETQVIEPSGIVVCTGCGHVLDQNSWSQEPTFTKEGGESTVAGHFVSNNAGSHGMGRIANGRIYGMQLDATEKAGGRAKTEIERIVDLLQIHPRDDVINSAQRLFMLAISHNFNKGRRTAQIAAAAIYIICRQENHPFMLLDFADVLQVNVFYLGSVFLQMCKIFRLEEHAIVTKPVDPSLYIHRFADRLKFGREMRTVADTALRLIRSMKQNWLQTGRRPSGLCGAALYIAGHMHGFKVSKRDVIRVVHVGEETLVKRVNEFTTTDEASLTAAQFKEQICRDEEEEAKRLQALDSLAALPAPAVPTDQGCSHIREGEALLFCDGMCRECYVEYIRVVGGHDGKGHNPPAFSAAHGGSQTLALEQEERFALPEYAGQGAEGEEEEASGASDEELEDEVEAALNEGTLNTLAKTYVPVQSLEARTRRHKRKRHQQPEPQHAFQEVTESEAEEDEGAAERDGLVLDPTGNHASKTKSHRGNQALAIQPSQAVVPADYIRTEDLEQPSETLSDLEDNELDCYLNTEEETKLKDIVWTAMNQDYIEKQALKAALKQKASAEEESAAKSQKKARGRPKGSRSKAKPEDELAPAESAAEGVRKMLDAKKLSSKINYDNLDSLFDGDQTEPAPKKRQRAAQARAKPKSMSLTTLAVATPASPAPGNPKKKKAPQGADKPQRQRKRRATPASTQPKGSTPASMPEVQDAKSAGSKLRSSALGSLKGSLPALQRRTTLAPLQ